MTNDKVAVRVVGFLVQVAVVFIVVAALCLYVVST